MQAIDSFSSIAYGWLIIHFLFFFQGDALQNDLSVGESLSILSTEALRRENHKKT